MDSVSETIEEIQQIEKGILFLLDSQLQLDGCITSKEINAYCDILLDKINQELYITSNLERDELNCGSDACVNGNGISSVTGTDSSNYCTESDQSQNGIKLVDGLNNLAHQHQHHGSSSFSSNIDKITNYRYSFYDNSNKISIYVASSSMISQMLQERKSRSQVSINSTSSSSISSSSGAPEEVSATPSIFGCHPNSIQRHSHGLFLPVFLEQALVYLVKFGLTAVGIFRKSGVKSRIFALKKQIEDGEQDIELDSLCVYDVADLVKTWLRDLRPHLVTKELLDVFASSKEDFSLWHLDDSHRYLLFVILKFLSIVCSHSKQNQMTAHNLAICFAPSLCDCETEHYILTAQRCLEHCIENAESLFCIVVSAATAKMTTSLNRHTSTAIISASPQDILSRLLYQRSSIDPLIVDWSIKDQTKLGDIFEVNLQFSSFLPNKTLIFKRNWTISETNCIALEELADSYNSTWHLKANGQGQTQVIHELELDLRGFSQHWYQTTFASVHDQQLRRLTTSFECLPFEQSEQHGSPKNCPKLLISEV